MYREGGELKIRPPQPKAKERTERSEAIRKKIEKKKEELTINF